MQTLRYAARLHDIGKLGISEATLHKNDGLSEDEWSMIREHPLKGERIVQSLAFLDRAKPVVRHHHERWDGSAYPDGLKFRGVELFEAGEFAQGLERFIAAGEIEGDDPLNTIYQRLCGYAIDRSAGEPWQPPSGTADGVISIAPPAATGGG